MEYAYVNDSSSNIDFSTNINKLVNQDNNEYDENQFENVDNLQVFNNNVFSKLHNLFKDEHERIYNLFECKIESNIEKSLDFIEYDSKKIIEEYKNEQENLDKNTENLIKNDIDINICHFEKDIIKLREYYSKLNIETFNLEKHISDIFIKHDSHYNKIKKICDELQNLEGIENFIENINKTIIEYSKEYFKKNKVDEKIITYQKNIKKINFLKKRLNKLNSLSFVPYCQICMTNIVDSVLIPCGHSGCDSCLNKCENKCFICRKEINNISKLFIL